MELIKGRPASLAHKPFHYCPGCSHGVIHRMLAESVDELGIREKVVLVLGSGCSGPGLDYFNFDAQSACHGRPPAVATGIKMVKPELVVVTYQGDGDLASIGTAEIVHAAARNVPITVMMINNATFGMTGGQMSPTTLEGQKSSTTPKGRVTKMHGYPIRVPEMLATLAGDKYLERVSVHTATKALRARKAITKALQRQIDGQGFSLVEVLSMCPTNWRLTPKESKKWLEDNLMRYFPLGVIKDVD